MNIYDTLDVGEINRPGDYKLSDINLISYQSEDRSSEPFKVSIETLVVDMNIYESIHNKTLSGNLLIVDSQNVVGTLPLTGHERLEFKFFTPSLSKGYDFSVANGNPMYVYKISKRQQVNPRAQMYLLHFCSKEMIQNELVIVSNAQTDTYANMVANITRNPDFLNSAKNIYIEPSIGLHKHVFTKIRPFDAIDKLALQTRSEKYYNSGYYFYETGDGFNFRSLESMLAVEANTARPALATFRPKPANIRDGGNKDIKNEMQIAMKYTITDQFDTLKNLRNGVFASTLITHDQLNKTVEETVFDYNVEYENFIHTENGPDGTKTDNTSILPLHKREGAFLSDFPQSTLYLWPQTSQTHYTNNTPIEIAPQKEILQRRLSQRLAFTSFKLELTVPGFTGLQAGDLITFEMPSYQPVGEAEALDRDPYVSGKYLVTSIRHQLNRRMNKHIMVLECMKDSVRRPYPEENVDTFIGKEKERRGVIDIYELDRIYTNSLDGIFS